MKKQLTAWLSIGSTYTYLTALRLEQVIARHEVDILFKPISIRSIMKEMDNSPFHLPSQKRYGICGVISNGGAQLAMVCLLQKFPRPTL